MEYTVKEMEKFIIDMSEEKFNEFCENCTKEQVMTMQAMRFFYKLYTDTKFYKAVEQTIAEVAYEELRAN